MSRPRRNTEHGMYGFARREKCRCDPCVQVQRRYAKRRQYDFDRGQARLVDASPAREHLKPLVEKGLTWRQISKVAGTSPQQIKNIVVGANGRPPTTQIYRVTAEKLLAVTEEAAHAAGYTTIDATGTRRRIEALRWLGHPAKDISIAMGRHSNLLNHYCSQDRVTTETAEIVKKVYENLHMTPGPSQRERLNAWRNNWLPPMAWDDSDIDNPDVEPDLSVCMCVVDKCTRTVQRFSVCKRHYQLLKEHGALADERYGPPAVIKSRLFRELVVDRFPKRTVYAHQSLLDELTELRELGFTMRGAAVRLGRSEKYIEKMWTQVA